MTVLLTKREELESKQESVNVQSDNEKHVSPKYSHITASISPFTYGFHDSQIDPFEALYSNTVDRPCSSVCGHDELDFFLNCRQPLSFFRPHASAEHDPDDDVAEYTPYPSSSPPRLPGMYDLPTHCEYCGASHTDHCDPNTCQRPILFFRKLRPPFASPDWEPLQRHSLIRIQVGMETSSSMISDGEKEILEPKQENGVILQNLTDLNNSITLDVTKGTMSHPLSTAESTCPTLLVEEDNDETDLIDVVDSRKLETGSSEISQLDYAEKGSKDSNLENPAFANGENNEIHDNPSDRIEAGILGIADGIGEKKAERFRCISSIQEGQGNNCEPLHDFQDIDVNHVDGLLLFTLDKRKTINSSLPSKTFREDLRYREPSSESLTTFTSTLFLTKSSRWEEFGLTNILVSPSEVEMVTAM